MLVVGNPANTNALIAAHAASAAGGLPRGSFTALTRLDQNRARAALARRLDVPVAAVSRAVIWGNHSTTQFPDARFALVAAAEGGAGEPSPVPAQVADDAWLEGACNARPQSPPVPSLTLLPTAPAAGAFVTGVQRRGQAVIDARGASSAASAAEAITQHVQDWLLGSRGAWVSMGVYTGDGGSEAPYGVAPDLVFSMPVTTERGGAWRVVPGLPVRADAHGDAMLRATEAELLHERELAFAPAAARL